MNNRPTLRLPSLRSILIVLVLTALQALLAWYLLPRMVIFQRFFYGDLLLLFGALDGTIGGLTMVRNRPYSANTSPVGVPAFQVQADEDEQRKLMVDELHSQRSFGASMLAISALTILLSLAVTYL